MRPTNAKSKSLVEHGHLACLCIYFICLSSALASVDVCQDPATYSHLSIAFDKHSDSEIDQGPGTVGLDNRNSDLLFKASNEKLLFGIGHRYSIFDVDPLQPETNGHLHSYFLPFHILTEADRNSFRLSVAPAISLSSNVGDRLNQYKDDAFQLLAAAVWSRRFSDRTSLRYGICGGIPYVMAELPDIKTVKFDAPDHARWQRVVCSGQESFKSVAICLPVICARVDFQLGTARELHGYGQHRPAVRQPV
jgi:hypothetical protein